jgi:hypothetical protein
LLEHPPLVMLRRLLHRSHSNPARVPSRLLAAAALAFAKEVAFRKVRPARLSKKSEAANALGYKSCHH